VELNRSRAVWLVLGAVLGVVLVVTVTAFTGTFLFGLFIYYATRPVYDRLRRRIASRMVAAAVALLTLAVPILLLLGYTLLLGFEEFERFTRRNNLEQYQTQAEEYLGVELSEAETLLSDPGALLSDPSVQGIAQQAFDQLLGVAGFLGTAGLHLFLMIVIAYYLLKDGRRLSRWAQGKFADDEGVMAEFFRAVDRDFQNVFFGNILNSFLTAILAAIVYSGLNAYVAPPAVQIPYPVLVGLLMAVGSLIPVVGILAVYVPVGVWVAALATSEPGTLWFPVVFFVVSFTVIGALPDFVLRPYVAAGSLHVGTVMLAYSFGPLLFGWYGIFLGPVLLVLVTHFSRIVLPELIDERTMSPYSIDPTYLAAEETPVDPSVAVDGGDPDATGPGDSSTEPPADTDTTPATGATDTPTEDGPDETAPATEREDTERAGTDGDTETSAGED
jgi:predicted PurR-regulated permease PerM